MEGYKYAPVLPSRREIRLLTIHPDLDRDSQVNCTLEVVSLNDVPKYHALSYTWGDPSLPRRRILLDGIAIAVMMNLEEAVRAFRHETNLAIFWIDAICINQQNSAEKAEQIQMMTHIFRDATVVDVFLGPGTDETDKAMDAINHLGTAAYAAGVLSLSTDDLRDRPDYDQYSSFKHPEACDPFAKTKRSIYELSSNIGADFPYAAWTELMERDYWNRSWVVQEFCLGRELTITCGRKKIPYRHCFEAAHLFLKIHLVLYLRSQDWRNKDRLGEMALVYSSLRSDGPCTALSGARNRQQRVKGSPESLFKLLEWCCIPDEDTGLIRQARYPRDLIYSLLGIASDANTLNVVPVYTRIDSTEETARIYASVTRKLLEHGHIGILAWNQQPKSLTVPSWVPDFTSIQQLPSCGSTEEGLFAASGQFAPNVKSLQHTEKDSPTTLVAIRGTIIDTVMDLGSPYSPNPDHIPRHAVKTTEMLLRENASMTRFMDEVAWFCDQAKIILSTTTSNDDQTWAEARWRIPCADQRKDKVDRYRSSPEFAQGYHDMRRKMELYMELARYFRELHLTPDEFTQLREQYDKTCTSASMKFQQAMEYQYNRKPFISKKGYVGLVPAHTEPGDIIIIIFGAIQPFVIRNLEQNQSALVGEAYVHGIMDGEFLQTKYEIEDFTFC